MAQALKTHQLKANNCKV